MARHDYVPGAPNTTTCGQCAQPMYGQWSEHGTAADHQREWSEAFENGHLAGADGPFGDPAIEGENGKPEYV